MRLTEKRIARLRRQPGRHRDGETRGLYLQVGESGTASWILRYERGGRERAMGLGPLHAFNLKEARAVPARRANYSQMASTRWPPSAPSATAWRPRPRDG